MNRKNLDKTRLAFVALVLGVTSIGCAQAASSVRPALPRPAALERADSKQEATTRAEERSHRAEISPVAAAVAVTERADPPSRALSRSLPSSAPPAQCAPGSGAAVHLRATRDRGLTLVGPLRRVVAPVCRIERLDMIDAASDPAYVPGANGFTSLVRLDW